MFGGVDVRELPPSIATIATDATVDGGVCGNVVMDGGDHSSKICCVDLELLRVTAMYCMAELI